MKTNDDRNRILNQLERALAQAIASSSEVSAAIRRIRLEGYSLNLILSYQPPVLERVAAHRTAARPASPPAFRLNGKDVDFLKSVGIDGTRRAVRRRRDA